MIPTLARAMIGTMVGAVMVVPSHGHQADVNRPGQAAAATGQLAGVVVSDDATEKPLRLAAVTLNPAEGGGRYSSQQVVTDDAGRFLFSGLEAGRFVLTVSKAGYVTSYVGSRRVGVPPARPIVVGSRERTNVAVKLLRGGVIAGRVLGVNTTLSPGMSVDLLQSQVVGGQRALISSRGNLSSDLDDRGAYRVYGLAPGEYFVSVGSRLLTANPNDTRQITSAEIDWALRQFLTAPPTAPAPATATAARPDRGRGVAVAPVYYPGTADPLNAVAITLGPAEVRNGVDFQTMLVPTASVRGSVAGPDGQPVPSLRVTMTTSGADAPQRPAINIRPAANGTFTTTGVPPGKFVVTARTTTSDSSSPMWATTQLTVDGRDVDGVTLTLRPGITISGRLAFEVTGNLPRPEQSGIRVTLTEVGNSTNGLTLVPSVLSAADGTFELRGVPPGRFFLNAAPTASTGSSNWMLRSVVVGDKDARDTPIDVRADTNVEGVEVHFTDRISELSGRLVDAVARPGRDYYIVAFSTDRTMWGPNSRRVRNVRPAADGTYRLSALPPGRYYICAVADIEPGQLIDDNFLVQLTAASSTLTIGEGEKKIQDFRVGGS